MEAVVPPDITAELTQILSNLVLGDNDIRQSAERAVNDRLAHSPELYLLALAQFAIAADKEVVKKDLFPVDSINYPMLNNSSDALLFSRPSSSLAFPSFSLFLPCIRPESFFPYIRPRLGSRWSPSYSIRSSLRCHSRQIRTHIASLIGA
jgi:hypothetical protein